MDTAEERIGVRPVWQYTCLALLWAALVTVRATAPADLADNAQHRQAAYVADLYYNGSWLYQRDADGSFQSKPPVYNWLAGVVAWCRGSLDEVSLYAPCALAALATALTTTAVCWKAGLPAEAALLAGVACLASPLGIKLVWLARTDTLFAALSWFTALAGFAALHGKNWLIFWTVAAAATLTKGPLAVMLAGVGMAGYTWCRRQSVRPGWRGMVTGFLLFSAITLGWLLSAVAVGGSGIARKLLGQELVQHALFGVERRVPFYSFYKPPMSFLARFFPWSVLAIAGGIRCWRLRDRVHPLLLFAAAYAALGLALLMVSPHHRADHLAPLLPAAAVVAAWWLSERLADRNRALLIGAYGAGALATLAAYVHYGLVRPNDPAVQRSIALKAAAEVLRSWRGHVHVVPYRATGAFQFYSGSLSVDTTVEPLLEALATGKPVVVVTTNSDALARELQFVDPQGWLAGLLRPLKLSSAPAAPEVRLYAAGPRDRLTVSRADQPDRARR